MRPDPSDLQWRISETAEELMNFTKSLLESVVGR